MRKMLIVLMLLAFTTAVTGCGDMQGPCPHGVCSEEHSKAAGPPAEGTQAPAEEKSGE